MPLPWLETLAISGRQLRAAVEPRVQLGLVVPELTRAKQLLAVPVHLIAAFGGGLRQQQAPGGGLRLQTSYLNLVPQTSDFRPRTSYLNLVPQTSDLRPQTPDLGPQTPDLRPQT